MHQPRRVFAEAETTAADKYVVSSINQDDTAPLVLEEFNEATPQAAPRWMAVKELVLD